MGILEQNIEIVCESRENLVVRNLKNSVFRNKQATLLNF